MAQILTLFKHFPGEAHFIEQYLGGKGGPKQLKNGTVFAAKVELWTIHFDEKAKDEVLSMLASMPAYGNALKMGESYDAKGELVKTYDSARHYRGFQWGRARWILDLPIKLFGGWFKMFPIPWPKKHEHFALKVEALGLGRTAGQIVPIAYIPDHKREGTEDL